jgi:hypothetical protein
MVDCCYTTTKNSIECHPTHYEHSSSCNTTTTQSMTDAAAREIIDYRSYILDQKELIKKIHLQQKKLKNIHSKSSASASSCHNSRYASVAPASRSCYFQSALNTSMPAPQTRPVCSALRHRPSHKSSFRQERHSNYLSTSLNQLDSLPDTDLCTSFVYPETSFNLNRSTHNLSQFVVLFALFLTLSSRFMTLELYFKTTFNIFNIYFIFICQDLSCSRLKSRKRHSRPRSNCSRIR